MLNIPIRKPYSGLITLILKPTDFMMPTAFRLLTFVAAAFLLSSCQNGQNPFTKKSSGGNDPYVSNYGNDGGYNPYPGQSGYAQSGGGSSAPLTYSAPPAPAEADPYAFSAPPTSTPKRATSSSSTPKKSTASKSKSTKSPAKKSGGSYQVTKGDTLYGIARKRGTTVAKIKAANKLSSDTIRPGQSLRIP